MFRLIPILLLCLLAGCADNPLGLTSGMWVRHEIDGQKYYISEVNLELMNDQGTRGYVLVKNEFGEEIDKKYPIHEFALWSDSLLEDTVLRREIPQDVETKQLVRQLTAARRALIANPTPENREVLEELIVEGEQALSPVFRERKWNPTTNSYE